MKNLLWILVFFAAMPAGCQSSAPMYPVAVTVEGQNISLSETDAANDTLISRKIDEDVDFDMESAIFAPLLESADIVRIPLNSTIEISLPAYYESAVLYDHLLQEDGTSYFNRSIFAHQLTPVKDQASFTVERHISSFLSSESTFLDKGSIRGFRLVITTGDTMREYAFVILVEELGGD